MDVIKASTLKVEFLKKPPNGMPLILVDPSARTMRKLGDAGYQEISLNRELAESLMKLPTKQRPLSVMQKTREILDQKHSGVIIRDFEMLFDPAYHLDVLRMFCELARQFRIAVVWCGSYHENTLEFAEPEYPDYHSYHTDHYTVYCIK